MKNQIIKTYKVDIDYENYLFDSQYVEDSPSNLKINKEFEYVFFLINKESATLKNCRSYNQAYLKKLKQLDFCLPDLDPNATSFKYWWGQRQNIELEKILNSKLTSAKLAIENDWGFQKGGIVKNVEDVKNHLQKYPTISQWILKNPNSFSGIGHRLFHQDSIADLLFLNNLNQVFLLEPVYERIFDVGTTFVVENGMIKRRFMVENFNSPTGRFKGGAGSSNVEMFTKYIDEKYSYSLKDLTRITLEIAEKYLKLGASSNIQIDSFIYREDEKLKLYSLVEVNYRKTMGLVIQSLADKHPDASWIEWKVEEQKNLKLNPLDNEWIKLSPEGNIFQSFLKINSPASSRFLP